MFCIPFSNQFAGNFHCFSLTCQQLWVFWWIFQRISFRLDFLMIAYQLLKYKAAIKKKLQFKNKARSIFWATALSATVNSYFRTALLNVFSLVFFSIVFYLHCLLFNGSIYKFILEMDFHSNHFVQIVAQIAIDVDFGWQSKPPASHWDHAINFAVYFHSTKRETHNSNNRRRYVYVDSNRIKNKNYTTISFTWATTPKPNTKTVCKENEIKNWSFRCSRTSKILLHKTIRITWNNNNHSILHEQIIWKKTNRTQCLLFTLMCFVAFIFFLFLLF